MRNKGKKAGSSLILWIIGIYLLFPLFLTFLYSMFTEWITIVPNGFSINAYLDLFQDSYFWQCIGRTLVISVIPIIICTVVVALAIVFGDLVIVNTLAGNYFPTGQMYLYAVMKQSGQKASAVIVLLFLVTLLISLAVFNLQKNKKKGR